MLVCMVPAADYRQVPFLQLVAEVTALLPTWRRRWWAWPHWGRTAQVVTGDHVMAAAPPTQKRWAFPVQRMDGMPGMLGCEEPRLLDPALPLTGHAVLSPPPTLDLGFISK